MQYTKKNTGKNKEMLQRVLKYFNINFILFIILPSDNM